MKEITILHLSDLHISKFNKNKKNKLISELIDDCKKNISEQVDFIFFTGDLVQAGTLEDFNCAIDVIDKLLSSFSIGSDKFIYIPGNHEVNVSSIKSYYFTGLQQENNKNSWNNYVFENDKDLCHQMSEYNSFKYSTNFNNNIVVNKIFNINNCKVGITAINSAWFSKGKTTDDRDRLFIPPQKIKDCYSDLENCEFKIAMLHHPYSFLSDEYVYDIERELGKYDLVISGHIHDDNIKTITSIPGNTALFITGNELNIDTSNGYAIYKISLINQTILVNMRKYYKKREVFDQNNEIYEKGTYLYEINSVPKEDKQLYELFINTKDRFTEGLDNLMITNVLDTKLNNSFSSSFILPKLTIPNVDNEYETNRSEISFNDLFNEKYKKIILTGKKEVGKTVLANYIALYYYKYFVDFKKIPVVINGNYYQNNSSRGLINIIKETINNYTNDDYSITNNKIKTFIENKSLILILDDFPKDNNKIYEELDKLKLDKIFIFLEENITTVPYLQTKVIFSKLKGDSNVLNVRIEEFTKNQIRKYSKLLLDGTDYNADELCSKTVSLFNEMSLPKTPFAVSLFISICSINSDFEPTNKSKIIEKLIEILLEKISPNDIYLKTYGFESKCSFLASLAYNMHSKNQYYYTINEFTDFVVNYHNEKMFPLEDTKFNELFFEKNILIKKNNKVMFRFKCFINYFLALHFSKYHEGIIELANSDKYYNYGGLFEYYSGINKGVIELASAISSKLDSLIYEVPNLNEILNLTYLQTELLEGLTEENVENIVPLDEEEKDELTDIVIDSEYDPTKIDTSKEKIKTEQLLYAMDILGSIVRNSEDFSGNDKIKYLKQFMKGSVFLTIKIVESLKEMLLAYKEELNVKDHNPEDYNEKFFEKILDMMKLTIPLIVQELILESVGTRKLKSVIENIINTFDEINSYEFLNYICLYADLRIENWEKLFIEFLEKNNNYIMQSLILIKCFKYLELNYFNDDLKKCKKVLMRIYELKGCDKHKANNLIDNNIRSITLKNSSSD